MTLGNRPHSAKQYPTTHKLKGTHIKRPYSARTAQLALHKESKRTWWTDYGGPLVWGNQETIWPLNPATQSYVATEHLKRLASPKVNHSPNITKPEFQYSCGRSSSIWGVPSSALEAVPTERVKELSKHKSAPDGFVQYFRLGWGRSSTIWRPSTAAMKLEPSSRPKTACLAMPKKLHENYQPPQQVQTVVSKAAQKCVASDRINELAVPKPRPDGPFREPEWPVSKGALKADVTPRTMELSQAKRLAIGYQPNKDSIWRITAGARVAVASSRLNELAKPVIRESMDHIQFNPDAFVISEAAKKYKASRRIEELAQPIQR